MQSLLSVFNSILLRIFGITLGLLLFTLALMITFMQTPLSDRVFDRALEESSQGIAELVWLLETSPGEVEGAILSTYAGRSRIAVAQSGFPAQTTSDPAKRQVLVGEDTAVSERLRDRDIRFRSLGLLEMRKLMREKPRRPYTASSALQIAIELEDGRVLVILVAPSVFYTDTPLAIFFLIGLITTVALVLGFAIYWVMMRPIRVLERDAELVGLAETSVPVSETGPRELRRLARALNRMRSRLASLVREREQMMVAIAHDLRTGITKLRLRMADRETVPTEAIEPDLNQMERLVSDMMAYARAENPVAEHELVELRSFVSELANATPYEVVIEDETSMEEFTIAGSKIALARMFENLLENARRYGGGEIILRFRQLSDGLEIAVEDNGPGMPPDDLEHAFEPFFRGEGSRSRATGGTGLGLGIARAIARTHGASITLSNRQTGGLCARLLFPLVLKT